MSFLRRLGLIPAAVLLVETLLIVPLAAEEQSPAGKDIVVVAEGLAACTSRGPESACRHAALADALRRAVEEAVGVLVEGDTRSENYQLVRDTVRTTAEGFVREYRILDEGRENDTYHVKIEARVAPGKPQKSLRYICRRLSEEVNPAFRVSVDDPAGADVAERAISGKLAALGLRTVTGRKASESSAGVVIEIAGAVEVDALGEPVAGTKIFSAGASAALSVIDSASGVVLPSVNVSLAQPVVAVSQDQANRQAVEAVSALWIERNIPLIAAALLEPGEPVAVEGDSPGDRISVPSGVEPNVGVPDQPDSGAAWVSVEGQRVLIEPGALAQLAQKLRASITEKSEFSSLPADIAVARFRTIGVSDPGLVEDVLEDLSTALVKTGVIELVERSQLDKVLRELRIQHSGLIDSATAKKLGKLVGARAVLVGSISDRNDCLVINARLINTESGRVTIAESIVVDKEREPFILRAGPRR